MLYKLYANNFYGNVSRGMSAKSVYNMQTKTFDKVPPGVLANPILASWTTSYIRAVIGELLHAVQLLGGRVVSVTTDGFLTDAADLEKRVIDLYSINNELPSLETFEEKELSWLGCYQMKNQDFLKSGGLFSLFREYRRARADYEIPLADGESESEIRKSFK